MTRYCSNLSDLLTELIANGYWIITDHPRGFSNTYRGSGSKNCYGDKIKMNNIRKLWIKKHEDLNWYRYSTHIVITGPYIDDLSKESVEDLKRFCENRNVKCAFRFDSPFYKNAALIIFYDDDKLVDEIVRNILNEVDNWTLKWGKNVNLRINRMKKEEVDIDFLQIGSII